MISHEVRNMANGVVAYLATIIGGGPFLWAADFSNIDTVGIGFIATGAAGAQIMADRIGQWARQNARVNIVKFVVGNVLQTAVAPRTTAVRLPGPAPAGPPPLLPPPPIILKRQAEKMDFCASAIVISWNLIMR